MRPTSPLFALCLAVLATGCTPKHEPVSPSVGLQEPVDPPDQPELGDYASRKRALETYRVFIITTESSCSGPYPTFDFDSAKLDSEEQQGLRALVECMKTGPLRERKVLVTGKTDPRGSEEYNDKLGLERAERVKRYLVARGISADRVLTASVGESDASPLPSDWPQDRHVQISEVP